MEIGQIYLEIEKSEVTYNVEGVFGHGRIKDKTTFLSLIKKKNVTYLDIVKAFDDELYRIASKKIEFQTHTSAGSRYISLLLFEYLHFLPKDIIAKPQVWKKYFIEFIHEKRVHSEEISREKFLELVQPNEEIPQLICLAEEYDRLINSIYNGTWKEGEKCLIKIKEIPNLMKSFLECIDELFINDKFQKVLGRICQGSCEKCGLGPHFSQRLE